MNHHLYRGLDVVNVPGRYKQEDAHFYIFSYELNGYSWGNGKLKVGGMGILRGQFYFYVNLCFVDKSGCGSKGFKEGIFLNKKC